jgi:hypothetical protein
MGGGGSVTRGGVCTLLQEVALTYEEFCICVQRLEMERTPATRMPRLRYLGNASEVVWVDQYRRDKLLGFLLLEQPALVDGTRQRAAPPHPQLCAFRHCSLNQSLQLKPKRAPVVRACKLLGRDRGWRMNERRVWVPALTLRLVAWVQRTSGCPSSSWDALGVKKIHQEEEEAADTGNTKQRSRAPSSVSSDASEAGVCDLLRPRPSAVRR